MLVHPVACARRVRDLLARERVRVIDEDLGKSGAASTERHGFQRLIAEIGLGNAGLVLSLDASRLARNNRDWHQLLELCSLFGVILADGERLYDPGAYHDRLLLGLSGPSGVAHFAHLGGMLGGLVDAVWTEASFLILPAMMIENANLSMGVKRATQIAKGNLLLVGLSTVGVRWVTGLIGFALGATGLILGFGPGYGLSAVVGG